MFNKINDIDTLLKVAEIEGDVLVTLSFPASLYDQDIFYSSDGNTPGILGIMKTCIEEAEDIAEEIVLIVNAIDAFREEQEKELSRLN